MSSTVNGWNQFANAGTLAGSHNGEPVRRQMPTLPQPNVRLRPYTAHGSRGPELPVGGVHYRTGDLVLPREYVRKKPPVPAAPLSARVRPVSYSVYNTCSAEAADKGAGWRGKKEGSATHESKESHFSR